MSRLLVLGDIHGAHKALVQVLERANVDRERDRIVFVGDVADGWPETRQCVEELLTLRNLTCLLGNHDDWFLQWMRVGARPSIWTTQGGAATIASYGSRENVPAEHRALLEGAKLWHQDGDRIFVHGGWPLTDRHPMSCGPETLMWDRSLWREATRRWQSWRMKGDRGPEPRVTTYDEVYVGHTTTEQHSLVPLKRCEAWNVDQGAGWGGCLSLMDVDTKEVWSSDRSATLYPEHPGRMGAA